MFFEGTRKWYVSRQVSFSSYDSRSRESYGENGEKVRKSMQEAQGTYTHVSNKSHAIMIKE